MGKRERKISRFTGHWITEQGAGTVEYVIVVLVAILIGSVLLAFGNQLSGQVTKTGNSISSWFSKANGTGGTGGGNAGGGNSGTDSRIDELKEKDPADWTLEDQKAVAEDITARKDELGFSAFSSAGMDGSSDWRYKTHLANLPIYFEYQEDGIDNTDAIKGTYLDNYKDIFDLYINNSTCDPAELAGKTGDDSRNEFLNEEAVFFQNGSWEYNNLVGDGKPFTDDDLTMIPIYVGAGDEANQGLCTGTENYWCVNKEASEDDINATLDFIYWCVSSDEGTKAMADDMGFVIPFKNAAESPNLFVKVDKEMTAAGKTPVAWNFSTMPSENWKNGVGSALTAYAAGTGSWDDVVTAFVDGWASEAALNAAA